MTAFGDERARDRGAEQELAFVHAFARNIGNTKSRTTPRAVLDENLLHTASRRFLARGLDLFGLAEVGGERHDFASDTRPAALQYHGGVSPP